MIYTVLVTFNNTILHRYTKTVVFIVEKFIPFLKNPLDLPSYPAGEAWGYAEARYVAKQQLELRAQYISMVLERGCPLPELVKMSPAVICGWNVTKHGIDTPCKYLSDHAPTHKKCSAPKMFVLRDVRSRAYNGMQMWRLLNLYPRLDEFNSYKKFKLALAEVISFNDTLYELVNAGLTPKTIRLIDPQDSVTISNVESSTSRRKGTSTKKRKKVHSPSPLKKAGGSLPLKQTSSKKRIRYRRDKWAASERGSGEMSLSSIRLSKDKLHETIHARELGVQKVGRCIVCCSECMGKRAQKPKHNSPWGFKTSGACNVCREFLCTQTKRWEGRSCWEVWHSEAVLPTFQCAASSKP